jgi:fumarate hydratase subunit alpha
LTGRGVSGFLRVIKAETITEAVAEMAIEACCKLGPDVLDALRHAREKERSELGKQVLDSLLENAAIAERGMAPICQDTGVAVVFVELGADLHVEEGSLTAAIEQGVRQGYTRGGLRKSIVVDPLDRVNTGDNTPPVVHIELLNGDDLKLDFLAKGAGSENASFLGMLKPSDGREGVVEFIVDGVVRNAPNSCPPVTVGVGIGGTMEKAALIAKKSLLRPLGQPHGNPEVAALESEMLDRINRSGIGPAGFGGTVTALAVHVETYPCHIASLPVAVNLECHAHRHRQVVL